MMFSKLVLGCGRKFEPYSVNLDIVDLPGVDVVHDMEVFPWPLPDNHFEYVKCEDILEHVDNIVAVMDEIYRIMKVGGKLWIRGPYALYPLQGWKDPTHRRLFVLESFDYWDDTTRYGKTYGFYGKAKFRVLERKEVNYGVEFLLEKV